MAGDAPNGSSTNEVRPDGTDVSGVDVCAVGTQRPIRIVDVTLRGGHGLRVTGFATKALPLPGDKEIVEGDGPLTRLGFSPQGSHLAQPCRRGWLTTYSDPSVLGSELAFAVGLAGAAHGTADGINVIYQVPGTDRTSVLVVDYPIDIRD